jgi:hypothetical protein
MIGKGLLATLIAVLSLLSGCKTIERDDIFARYYSTTLKQSTAADVLSYIQDPNTEHLSQSESVISSWGEINKTRSHWFNLVAFDEEQQMAARKYAMTLEDYRGPNTRHHANMRFDAEVVMDSQTLNDAYASKNLMRIEVIKKLRAMVNDDAQAVSFESETLRRSTSMVNQAIKNLLNKLDQSPGLAEDLAKVEGLEFDHITLGRSYARLLIEDDIVKLKIKCGALLFNMTPFKEQRDVIDM